MLFPNFPLPTTTTDLACGLPSTHWRRGRLKFLTALLSLATLVSCAAPAPEPLTEAAVVQPAVTCRVGRDGGPMVTDRGIGGTGAPAGSRLSDRGIGGTGIDGTGIVGVVTGFASICVDGLEVRLEKTAAVSINGSLATPGQLRVGQLVVIKAAEPATTDARARMIAVRYEVLGPIESIDTGSGAMTVAGQRVMVLPSTWMATRFGLGHWVSVSGLRQPDGTIIASRLDRARAGALAVRGKLIREQGTTSIGNLVLHGAAADSAKPGTFVSIVGKYIDMAAEATSIDPDLLQEDPAGFFGTSASQLILQAFVHVEHGTVWLGNGQKFSAGPQVQGNGGSYRNAIVRLQRTSDGAFAATAVFYTSYRAQPKDAPTKTGGNRGGNLVLPPDAPPGPPMEAPPAAASHESVSDGAAEPAAAPSPAEVPTSDAAPPALTVAVRHLGG